MPGKHLSFPCEEISFPINTGFKGFRRIDTEATSSRAAIADIALAGPIASSRKFTKSLFSVICIYTVDVPSL